MLLGSYPIPCPFMSCPFLLLHSTLEKQGKAMGIADTTLYLRQRMEISTAHQVHHLLTQPLKSCCCEVTPSPSTEWLLRSYHGLEVVFL